MTRTLLNCTLALFIASCAWTSSGHATTIDGFFVFVRNSDEEYKTLLGRLKAAKATFVVTFGLAARAYASREELLEGSGIDLTPEPESRRMRRWVTLSDADLDEVDARQLGAKSAQYRINGSLRDFWVVEVGDTSYFLSRSRYDRLAGLVRSAERLGIGVVLGAPSPPRTPRSLEASRPYHTEVDVVVLDGFPRVAEALLSTWRRRFGDNQALLGFYHPTESLLARMTHAARRTYQDTNKILMQLFPDKIRVVSPWLDARTSPSCGKRAIDLENVKRGAKELSDLGFTTLAPQLSRGGALVSDGGRTKAAYGSEASDMFAAMAEQLGSFDRLWVNIELFDYPMAMREGLAACTTPRDWSLQKPASLDEINRRAKTVRSSVSKTIAFMWEKFADHAAPGSTLSLEQYLSTR